MAIPLNDNVRVLATKPQDPRYFQNNNTPWPSIEALNAGLPVGERHPELTVDVMGVEYWWKNGAWILKTDDTKLDRGSFVGTAQTLDDKIDNQIVNSTALLDPNIAIPAEITGNVHILGVGPGTYLFWENQTVPANNIATLRRVNGVFSMSLTPINLPTSKSEAWTNVAGYAADVDRTHLGKLWKSNAITLTTDVPGTSSKWTELFSGYLENIDVVNNLNSSETNKPGSANNDRLLDQKIANIIKDVEETGTFFTNEAGEVFFKFNADGADFSKVSESLKAKIITVAQELGTSLTDVMSQDAVTTALSSVQTTKDTEEDGAFLCNENGQVFYKFNQGVSELIGFDNPTNQPTINELEDIDNVVGAVSGQYLKKMPDGTWAGAIPPISEPSFMQLTSIAEGIVQDGLVQMDARANHPMYGKNYFVFGDSHTASAFRFYSRIAEATGAIYHEMYTKTVSVNGKNEIHFFIRKLSSVDYITYINEVDTGVIPNCDGFNLSQMSHVIYTYAQSLAITVDYILVANCHFDLWEFYNTDGTIREYPPAIFINPTKTFSRVFSNAGTASAFFNTTAGIIEMVDELGFTTIDSTIKVRYGTTGQTLTFSFSSGTTLNVNTVAKIHFGTDTANSISTTLTAGMNIEQCVDAINQWAFQEYSTWINTNKGVFGGANIALTYSSVVGGNADGVAVLTTTPTSNLQMNTPVISAVSNAYTLQYCSKDVAGLRVATNWLTAGGNVNWTRPHTMIGAMQYIGKFSPYTKWVFLGIWNNALLSTDVYPDGTINPYLLLNNGGYKAGQRSKTSLKNVADLFGGQYIDVDKLCGINPFNVVPTFNSFNDVHLKQEGYIRSVDTIVRNVK